MLLLNTTDMHYIGDVYLYHNIKKLCWHWQNKRYYIQHSNKLILKLTCNCLKYPYCQTSIHTTDWLIFTIQNTKENYTPFLLCFHSYHLFSPTKHLNSHPLKTIFQHKVCTDKLYADSFYKIQKNSHSSFEVICCRR